MRFSLILLLLALLFAPFPGFSASESCEDGYSALAHLRPLPQSDLERESEFLRFVDLEDYRKRPDGVPGAHTYGRDVYDSWKRADDMLNAIPVGRLDVNKDLIRLVHDVAMGSQSFAEVNRYLGRTLGGIASKVGEAIRKRWGVAGNSLLSPLNDRELANIRSSGLVNFRELPFGLSRPDSRRGLLFYTPREEVEKSLDELVAWYNANKGTMDPVKLAANFQQRLVAIHPFLDGNGRTSRLLMDRILKEFGLSPAVFTDMNADLFSTPDEWEALVRAGIARRQMMVELERNGTPILHNPGSSPSRVETPVVGTAVSRPQFDENKQKAIQEANALFSETYTLDDWRKQQRILRRAGFSREEIQKLRADGVVGAAHAKATLDIPITLSQADLSLRTLDSAAIKELQGGKKLSYVIDTEGRLFLTDQALASPDAGAVFVVRGTPPGGKPGAFVARESGELRWNPQTSKMEFQPSYGTPRSREELAEIAGKELPPESRVAVEAKPLRGAVNHTRTLDCLAIRENQSLVRNLVLNKVLAANVVTSSGIALGELVGHQRLASEDGRRVVMGDMTQANVSALASSGLFLYMNSRNWGTATRMAASAGALVGLLGFQKVLYSNLLTGDDASSRANSIVAFDAGWYLTRGAMIYPMDNFVLNRLPNYLHDQCMKGSRLSVVLSPGMIRIYENVGMTLIYYSARKAVIGQ